MEKRKLEELWGADLMQTQNRLKADLRRLRTDLSRLGADLSRLGADF